MLADRRAARERLAQDAEAEAAAAVPLAGEDSPSSPRGGDGYAELGSAADALSFQPGAAVEAAGPHRLHPGRLFYPGQFYQPHELDPYGLSADQGASARGGRGASARGSRRSATLAELLRADLDVPASNAAAAAPDFRNTQFFVPYISHTGHLQGRAKTQLSAKLQRRVARAAKTARQMGLLPIDSKPGFAKEIPVDE